MTAAAETIIHAKALAWGGSIGIRISKAEAARLGIRPGQELNLKVLHDEDRIDISHLVTFSDGLGADNHDEVLAEARIAELERGRR